jgi:fucose permease
VRNAAYVQGIRGFAYLAGALCGPLYDRVPGHTLMSIALMIGGICTAVLPAAESWWGLAVICALQGFWLCFVDTGCNVLLLALTEGDPAAGTWMQALHFCFALGAFVAPLLLRAAEHISLANSSESDDVQVAGKGSYTAAFVIMGVSCFIFAVVLLFFSSPRQRSSNHGPDKSKTGNDNDALVTSPAEADVLALNPLPENAVSPAAATSLVHSDAGRADIAITLPKHQLSRWITCNTPAAQIWQVVALASCMLCSYVGTETGFGFFATSYAVFSMGQTEAVGQYLTSAFWGSLTIGRFLAIPLSVRFSPWNLLACNLSGCVITTILFLLFKSFDEAVWVLTCFLGLFMACIFPSAMSLVESYFPVQGIHATAFVVGCALGEWAFPFVISTYIGGQVTEEGVVEAAGDGPGPQIVLWVALVGSCFTLLGFGALQWRGPIVRNRITAWKLSQGVAPQEAV